MHVHDGHGNPVKFSIQLCPSGCLCLAFGVAIIHLARADFESLVRTMNQAAEELGMEVQPSVLRALDSGARH